MYITLALISFAASLLTFFSGFGLGTILTPVFMIFFPIEVAVAMTAVVHFANNLFKFALLRKHLNLSVLLRFGLPALVAAATGAYLLSELTHLKALGSWSWQGNTYQILPLKVILAIVMFVFVLWEVMPATKNLALPEKYLPLGGLLSGFFGGLSGHQGALRSAFLSKVKGMNVESFLITGVSIGILVDVARLLVYQGTFVTTGFTSNIQLLSWCIVFSFAGALFGHYMLKKITLRKIQILVTWLLVMLALGLGTGFI